MLKSSSKEKAIDKLFESLDKDDISVLESTIKSNAISEFKKLKIKEPSLDEKLNSKSIVPYISQNAEDEVEKVPNRCKISEACNISFEQIDNIKKEITVGFYKYKYF